MFVIGAAGYSITEEFVSDVAAGIHAANGVVGAGGLAIELFGAGDFVQVALAVVVVRQATANRRESSL